LLACGLVLAAGACGGSTAPVARPQISDATAAGDGICTSLFADQKALVDQFHAQHPTPSKDDATDFLVNTLIPRVERAVGDFHRIGEPTKDRQSWDLIVQGLDSDLSTFKIEAGGKNKDDTAIDPVKVIDLKPFADLSDQMTLYGFKECPKVNK
jgi:hypothetical protein